MELRTTFNIEPFPDKITYNDKVMFIGSCFASNMGLQMAMGHMPVLINPAGAVFNPVSVCNTIDSMISGKKVSIEDLHYYNGTWISFYHYTDFTSEDSSVVLEKINKKSQEAYDFLRGARFLFITLGTARVYRLKESNLIVSNCHKIPGDRFESKLLSVDEIVSLWSSRLDKLKLLFPDLIVVFTISPVRHWKDGHHGNQVSKSILFVAVEELLQHDTSVGYFPAYEIVMDDLRDYRFYNDDMLHPSAQAINYIWEAFSGCYLDKKAIDTWKEIVRITKAANHRLITDSPSGRKQFAENMINQIAGLKIKYPDVDLSREEEYFLKMRNV
jgi:hypothetical protein